MNSKILCITSIFFSFSAIAEPSSPAEVCKKLVEKAKANDFEGLKMLSRGEHPKRTAKHFQKTHKNHMERIKEIQCGAEHVAEERAFVEAEISGKKRFIPFVKDGADWKFDTRTYLSFYFDGKSPK